MKIIILVPEKNTNVDKVHRTSLKPILSRVHLLAIVFNISIRIQSTLFNEVANVVLNKNIIGFWGPYTSEYGGFLILYLPSTFSTWSKI